MSLTSPRSTGSFRTFFPRNCSTSLFSQRLTTTTPVTLETISVSRLSHAQAVFLTHDRLHRFLSADLAAELRIITTVSIRFQNSRASCSGSMIRFSISSSLLVGCGAGSPPRGVYERIKCTSRAEDDRVEDANAEELSRLPKATADLDVLWARFDRAARMIVRDDDGC